METSILKSFRVKAKYRKNIRDAILAIKNGEVHPNIITKSEKVEITGALTLQGWTRDEIAELLQVKVSQVSRWYALILNRRAKVVGTLTREQAAGQLLAYAEKFVGKALRENNISLAWQISKDMIRILQDMGIIYEAPKKIDAIVKAEIDVREISDDDLIEATKSIFTRGPSQN